MNYFHMIRKRLITLGVKPKDARKVCCWFQTQVTSRGPLGALSHFKDVGDTLKGYLSKSGYKAKWVKTTQGGYPKSLECLRDYPIEVQLRAASIARAILLKSPTPEMVSKLKNAAIGPREGSDEAYSRLSHLIQMGIAEEKFPRVSFVDKYTTALKSARTYTNRSVPTGTEVGLDLEKLFSTFRSWGHLLTDLPNWPDLMYPLHPSYVGRTLMQYGTHEHVGEVGGVMEQGGKLRIFAAPSVLLNNALEPLQVYLDKFREFTSWDCFKNQSLGKDWAISKMNEGHDVHSIDLSSATCRFPFEVQLELCKTLDAPEYSVELYSRVARGTYKVQPHLEALFGSELTWTVGQPLGVNPSMSSFALCHGLLLVGLCLELKISPSDSFRILGDDVVTCNTQLATSYRQVISSLGIGISEHKSYVSNNYAEFAGFCILGDVAVRPGRWKLPSQLNIVGLIADLGADVTNELDASPTPALLMAFRGGTYTPLDPDEWGRWLKLNSLTMSTERVKYPNVRPRSWFDGAVAFLQKELKSANPYFDSEKQEHFLDTIPSSIVKDAVDMLCPTGYSMVPTETGLVWLELCAQDLLPMGEYASYCEFINESYEAYTWSRPKTPGRKDRDALADLTNLLDRL